MDLNLLVPLTLFVCIAYTVKAVVDSFNRRRIVEARGSEELVRALLDGEIARRRLASLHWGCVLVALALGFGIVELLAIERTTPGVVGLLIGATGLGNLAYYLLESRLK